MPITQVVMSGNKRSILLPFSGAGSNVPAGTPVMRGVTGGTNIGVAIPITATSSSRSLGLLAENHVYATSGDCTTATLVNWFAPNGGLTERTQPSHPIELLDTSVLVAMDYYTSSTVAVASATSTVVTITSAEASLDGSYIYVNAGVGIGQLEFVISSTTSDLTVSSAMGTTLTNTSKLTKILPHFHDLPVFKVHSSTQATLLDSTAAVGAGRAVQLGQYMVRNGNDVRLDPKAHHNLTGLNSLSSLRFYALIQFVDTAFHPIA